jgi:hypothetical protein
MLSSRPHLWHLIIIRHHILSVYTRSISTRSNVYSGLLFIAFTLGNKASNPFQLNKKECQIRIDNHRVWPRKRREEITIYLFTRRNEAGFLSCGPCIHSDVYDMVKLKAIPDT